ncbi:hypothetical protein DFS34DRAFT_616634 [Phlyctochytrium arcticum]|nr:hypothetical protein DFS34DRAFT_616634 [Phlyctochytrium arcticum]
MRAVESSQPRIAWTLCTLPSELHAHIFTYIGHPQALTETCQLFYCLGQQSAVRRAWTHLQAEELEQRWVDDLGRKEGTGNIAATELQGGEAQTLWRDWASGRQAGVVGEPLPAESSREQGITIPPSSAEAHQASPQSSESQDQSQMADSSSGSAQCRATTHPIPYSPVQIYQYHNHPPPPPPKSSIPTASGGVPRLFRSDLSTLVYFLNVRRELLHPLLHTHLFKRFVMTKQPEALLSLLTLGATKRSLAPSASTVEALFLMAVVSGDTQTVAHLVTYRPRAIERRFHLAGILATRYGRVDLVRFFCEKTDWDPMGQPNAIDIACGATEPNLQIVEIFVRWMANREATSPSPASAIPSDISTAPSSPTSTSHDTQTSSIRKYPTLPSRLATLAQANPQVASLLFECGLVR